MKGQKILFSFLEISYLISEVVNTIFSYAAVGSPKATKESITRRGAINACNYRLTYIWIKAFGSKFVALPIPRKNMKYNDLTLQENKNTLNALRHKTVKQ